MHENARRRRRIDLKSGWADNGLASSALTKVSGIKKTLLITKKKIAEKYNNI